MLARSERIILEHPLAMLHRCIAEWFAFSNESLGLEIPVNTSCNELGERSEVGLETWDIGSVLELDSSRFLATGDIDSDSAVTHNLNAVVTSSGRLVGLDEVGHLRSVVANMHGSTGIENCAVYQWVFVGKR